MKQAISVLLMSFSLICFFKVQSVEKAGNDDQGNAFYAVNLSLDNDFSALGCAEAFPFDVSTIYTKDGDKFIKAFKDNKRWVAVGLSLGDPLSLSDVKDVTGYKDLPKKEVTNVK